MGYVCVLRELLFETFPYKLHLLLCKIGVQYSSSRTRLALLFTQK